MIIKCDDGKNKIFDFEPDSDAATSFKKSKRGKLLQKLPKFSTLTSKDSVCNNVSCSNGVTKMMKMVTKTY